MTQEVIGYVRVSTNEQFSQGGSVQAQENMIRKFCTDQKLKLVEIFSEKTHVSTRVPMVERLEGRHVVDLMNSPSNKYGLVLVKLDRAFRSTAEAITHVNNWSKNKSVYILDFMNGKEFDSNDPMMKMLLSIMSVFAELERDSISKRTRFVLKDKKENLESYCGKVYGYDLDMVTGTLKPNEDEQAVLETIFTLYSQGSGLRKISNYLNENGYSAGRGGKAWYASTISYILKNDLYADIAARVFRQKAL